MILLAFMKHPHMAVSYTDVFCKPAPQEKRKRRARSRRAMLVKGGFARPLARDDTGDEESMKMNLQHDLDLFLHSLLQRSC